MLRSSTQQMVFKLCTFAFACFAFNTVSAQGNLVFNQVINISLSGNGTENGSTNEQVIATQNVSIPANSVLKVESVSLNKFYSGTASLVVGTLYLTVDGVIYSTTYQSNATIINFPVWLASGNHVVKLSYHSMATYAFVPRFIALLSAIQFSVVP